MFISNLKILELQNKIKINEVISEFIALKKKGENFWSCCPFHSEKTPSFSISPIKNFYKCFGCGVSGDSISFIQKIQGISFLDAVKYLAKKYQIDIGSNKKYKNKINIKNSIYLIIKITKEYYLNKLWNTKEGEVGLEYFKSKNFSDFFIKKFELGYSGKKWNNFYQFSKEKINIKNLINLSLIIKKKEKKYDFFRERLMFPIHDIDGRVIAFGGRIIKSKNSKFKYINSSESVLYKKNNILYGIFYAKKKIREKNNCFLVEGYTDVIRLHMNGIENVVGSLGTSITNNQINIIKKFTNNIVILFDGDIAGIKATLNSINMIIALGVNVKIISLPLKEDPDSYAQKVGEIKLKKYFKNNLKSFLYFKYTIAIKNFSNDYIKKSELIKDILFSISFIPDLIQKTILIQDCSKIFKINEIIFLSYINFLKKKKKFKKEKKKINKFIFLSKKNDYHEINIQEKEIIRILILYSRNIIYNNKYFYDYLIFELEDMGFITLEYKKIFYIFKLKLLKGVIINYSYFTNYYNKNIQSVVLKIINNPYKLSNQWLIRYNLNVKKEKNNLNKLIFKNILMFKFKLVQKLIKKNYLKLKNILKKKEENNLLFMHNLLKKVEIQIANRLNIILV